ncbi:membrane-spanning 4-domains subfamily A member 4A [Pagrus major]|uniref:membrane-spanning 4-domains subfamily A member 4A n=1 Tax=Pagrus major TaxID=143350 RepID=UPI003CC8D007
MTSTSVTKIGGVVVVTQVIPQEEKSIPLQSAAISAQAPPTATHPARQAPPPAPTKMDDMTSIFMKAGPQCLGVVQIFIGVLCILFSLTAAYSPALLLHAPFCLGVTFVVSGSLALAAVRRTSVELVRASLVWNVIGAVMGLVGVAFTCWLLADRSPGARFCARVPWGQYQPTEDQIQRCNADMRFMNVSVYGSLGLLLVLLVLQVCVAVTVCVFSARAIRRHDNYAPLRVEVDDCTLQRDGASSPADSDVALLDSECPNSP